MSGILITIKKEIRTILRDKKTFMMMFVFPVFIPIMIFLYGYMFDGLEEESYDIGINYEINSTESTLINEVNLIPIYYESLEDMEDAYDNGEIGGYIDYSDVDNKYTIYTNKDSTDGSKVYSYINAYLIGYNDYLGELYLIGEDIDMEKVNNNFLIEEVNLKGENYLLETLFSMSFTYIIMAIIMAVTNMATSATAVEKENGTMETLLTFPVRVKDLIIGKYIATSIVGFISSVVGLVFTIVGLIIGINTFEAFSDLTFTLNFINVIWGIIILLLASLFVAGVGILIISKTKSFKEAQSVSSVFSLIALFPMMISLMGLSVGGVYYLIPICNYTQILMDLFSGVSSLENIIFVISSSLIYIMIVVFLVINTQKNESILFQGDCYEENNRCNFIIIISRVLFCY